MSTMGKSRAALQTRDVLKHVLNSGVEQITHEVLILIIIYIWYIEYIDILKTEGITLYILQYFKTLSLVVNFYIY